MTMSPDSSVLASSSITPVVIAPAGTITHTTRGAVSFSASSCSEDTPVVLSSPAIASTASGLWSYTTHSCPPVTTRRAMLAPIRPRPIIPSCIVSLVSLLFRGRAVRQPRLLPSVVTTHQLLRSVGPPGALVVMVDSTRLVQHRLHDSPRLFDGVLAGEQLAISIERGVEQTLVGAYRFAEILRERGVQVNVVPRVAGLGGQLQPHPGVGVDAQHDLVGIGWPAVGQERKAGNVVEEHPDLGDLLRQRF